jgi:hypothetical protein
MTLYSIALFVHLIGVIVLFIAFGIGQRAGARMRGAGSVDHALLWLGLLRVTTPMFPTALTLLLGSGLFMTADAWSFTTPWVAVSIVAVVIVGGLGAGHTTRSFGRMSSALEAADGKVTDEVRAALDDSGTWMALFAINGMSFAVLWLMVVKPGWLQSIVLPAVLFVVGGALGFAAIRQGMWSTADNRPDGR